MAQFKKGNKAAKGGARAGSGRKSDAVKAAIKAALTDPQEDGDSLFDKAIANVKEGLEERDENGLMTPAACRMTEEVLGFLWGKKPQAVNMDGEVTVKIVEVDRAPGTHRRDS